MNLKIISLESKTKEKLKTPFPQYVLKEKPGKGNLTYVAGQAVIDKLNDTFGYAGWEWNIVKAWVEESVDKVTTSKWENGRKVNLKPEDYVIEPQLPVCHVIGKLTVHFEREDGSIHSVTKEAPGAQPIVAGQTNQENCYKGAHTDALKKAATLFGVALELYRDDKEEYFFNELSYEDPWTDEELKKHEKSFSAIKSFKEAYQMNDQDMNGYVAAYLENNSATTAWIVPDNIEGFVSYLKTLIENSKEEQKGA